MLSDKWRRLWVDRGSDQSLDVSAAAFLRVHRCRGLSQAAGTLRCLCRQKGIKRAKVTRESNQRVPLFVRRSMRDSEVIEWSFLCESDCTLAEDGSASPPLREHKRRPRSRQKYVALLEPACRVSNFEHVYRTLRLSPTVQLAIYRR